MVSDDENGSKRRFIHRLDSGGSRFPSAFLFVDSTSNCMATCCKAQSSDNIVALFLLNLHDNPY